ncbi:MerR family transcriptional regulator [Nucisporomicrobium flavum]|uniref:MerR family transcriptional regulator n=1 Tax=Nucisporomicrobium flavum TaxID=2785915 RepID=UPI003C2FBE98
MDVFTIQEAARRTGLTEPTLRYYEEIGLLGPIERDERHGHRRYGIRDLDELEILACLRAVGMGIEDMRSYQTNRSRGRAAAGEQRDLLLRHAGRIEVEIEAQRARLGYLRAKAAMWDARDRGDEQAEADAMRQLVGAFEGLAVAR